MRSRFRSFIAATAVAVAAVTGGVVAAAPAGAAPPPRPLPTLSIFSDVISTVGDHDFCRGAFRVGLSSPRRGVTRMTLVSSGFTGNGAGWKRNPRCSFAVGVYNSNGLITLSEKYFTVSFGPRRGDSMTQDIVTGSGLRTLGVGTYAVRTPVRLPQSYPASLTYIAP